MAESEHPFLAQILNAAVAMAEKYGWRALTRDRVAEYARVGAGSINTHFGRIENLRDAVMDEVVRRANSGDDTALTILAQGLCDGHPSAKAAPVDLKRRALDLML